MADPCLTIIEATGIQPYISGSNRLQENIGASEQVYRATTLWAWWALEKSLNGAGEKHNIDKPESFEWDLRDVTDSDAKPQAEVVYGGGGKTLIIFRDGEEAAKKFVTCLTNRVLREAPGLTLAVAHQPFSWDKHAKNFNALNESLLQNLEKHKQEIQPSMPLLGLGVTAVCQSTGLPAMIMRTDENKIKLPFENREIPLQVPGETEPPRLISLEIAYKLGFRDLAQTRLKHLFGKKVLERKFDFPSDMDKLGREMGEESYVAVIHADGNRMGKHFSEYIGNKTGYPECAIAMRAFSKKVRDASKLALKSIIDKLADRNITKWVSEKRGYFIADKIPLSDNRNLPFRPLVYGGDDVTFVCNARLGLWLATAYLKAFKAETTKQELPNMYACAGIAMVKMHYPFARAYALSNVLCSNAKRYVRKEIGEDCSALDWHFAISGLGGSLSQIRQREYEVDIGLKEKGKLYLRPVRLTAKTIDTSGRYWEGGIEKVIREFQEKEKWTERKNKVVRLREVLRQGENAVKEYREDFRLPLLSEFISREDSSRASGWAGARCMYFDALEMLDHFVAVE
jgi:hypothetical protein